MCRLCCEGRVAGRSGVEIGSENRHTASVFEAEHALVQR